MGTTRRTPPGHMARSYHARMPPRRVLSPPRSTRLLGGGRCRRLQPSAFAIQGVVETPSFLSPQGGQRFTKPPRSSRTAAT
jgi:hypothetical protein